MSFVWLEFLPVIDVVEQVDFLNSPEGSQMLLVQVVDRMVFDRKEDESTLIFSENGLFNQWSFKVLGVVWAYAAWGSR